MTAWEHSHRVPLVIAAPWIPASHGRRTAGWPRCATFIGRSLISQTSTRRRWTRALRATAWRQHSRIRPVRASPMRSRRPSTSAARRSKPSAFRLAVLCRQLLRPQLLQPQPGLGVDGLLGRSTGWRFTEWLRCDGARLCPHAPKLNAPAPPADTSPNAGRTGRSSMATSCAPVKVVPEHCWHGQGDERTGGCPKRDVLRELRDHPHLHQLCPGYQRDHGDPAVRDFQIPGPAGPHAAQMSRTLSGRTPAPSSRDDRAVQPKR